MTMTSAMCEKFYIVQIFTFSLYMFSWEQAILKKSMLFKKTSVPKYTWGWINGTSFGKVKSTEDCGSLCSNSVENFNALKYDGLTSICSVGYVGLLYMNIGIIANFVYR